MMCSDTEKSLCAHGENWDKLTLEYNKILQIGSGRLGLEVLEFSYSVVNLKITTESQILQVRLLWKCVFIEN